MKRPMKAPIDPVEDKDLNKLIYPIVGSPKLDGFRCMIVDKVPLTSRMKIWPNPYVREMLSKAKFNGLDGELLIGDPKDPNAFWNTSGALRRHYGEPDFRFYVFDNFIKGEKPYNERWISSKKVKDSRIIVLEQKLLRTPEEVIAYEKKMLAQGYEGAMIRSLDGRYKQGRCTFNEMNIFKRKPFVECEAVIIGFEESMLNMNVKFTDERGLSKRSSHKENMVPKGTLGAFILKSPIWEKEFRARAGEGFNQEMKQKIWDNRFDYINQMATVKYQKYGSREAPRQPSVIKIRPLWDLK